MVIISYATTDDYYRMRAERLQDSARQCGMTIDMEFIEPDSKMAVHMYKPEFIARRLLRYQRPVVWMDADALIAEPFELPEGSWDVGLVPNNRDSGDEMCSFIAAFKYTAEARHFVNTWAYLCSWPGLTEDFDHRRMSWTRDILRGKYREIDLSKSISGAVIRDYRSPKEHRF